MPVASSLPSSAAGILAWLARRGSRRNIDGMARYGIRASKAFGVSMAVMRPVARHLRPDHVLARDLWASGWHEARVLAALIDDPAQVTVAQMDEWAGGFDNWALCDTTCIQLFCRAPQAWRPIARWARDPREFVRRAAFAQIAALSVHDRHAPDARFLDLLPGIRRAATDERPLVTKAISWALRAMGQRSAGLHDAVRHVAAGLAGSEHDAARWIGRDVGRDLSRPIVRQRIERRAGRAAGSKLVSSRRDLDGPPDRAAGRRSRAARRT